MCTTCGCGADEATLMVVAPDGSTRQEAAAHDHPHDPSHSHEHSHPHEHSHAHAHDHAGPQAGAHPHDHAAPDNRAHPRDEAHPKDSAPAHEHSVDSDGIDPHHPSLDSEAMRARTVDLEQRILAKNDHLAEHNRWWLSDHHICAVNLMSSPGAGKTTLLERTIAEFGSAGTPESSGTPGSPGGPGSPGRPGGSSSTVYVIEGDQETSFDADRIARAGARAVQVNTGAGCHLDASMVDRALAELQPEPGSVVFIENVGNLVCPALFDLGEAKKVVVISVTEGDDKPLKYPHMFAAADLVLVNKMDLLPYVDFDLARLKADARKLNPGVQLLAVSARTGENLPAWYAWLRGGFTLTPRRTDAVKGDTFEVGARDH